MSRENRRWHVKYDLAYDGGGSEWTGRYSTKFIALIAIWLNKNVKSWGGSAKLIDMRGKE